MAEHQRRPPEDMDTILESLHFVFDADFDKRLRARLRASLTTRKRTRPLLGRVRAWVFSYPNGYHVHEEQDETMNKSKLLTAFSVGILVLALAAFVGLVIVLPSLESLGEVSLVAPSESPGGADLTGTSEPPSDENPFKELEYCSAPITASNLSQLQELLVLDDDMLWHVPKFHWSRWIWPDNAVSPDSAITAEVSHDESRPNSLIVLRGTETGGAKWIEGHSRIYHPFNVLRFTGNDKLVTGSGDSHGKGDGRGYVDVWDTQTGEQLFSVEQDGSVTQLVLSQGSATAMIASGGSGGTIRLRSTDLQPLAEMKVVGLVNSLAFSPDGRILASASQAVVQLWDVPDGTERMVLEGHAGLIKAIAFSSDGSLLASGGQDGTVRLWDVMTGQELLVLEVTGVGDSITSNWVENIIFSPDGTLLYVHVGLRRPPSSGTAAPSPRLLGIPPCHG